MGGQASCHLPCLSRHPKESESPFKAARSVHLWWKPAREPADVTTFCNAIQVLRSTPGSYFMACGFDGGYFGIQEMMDGSRRVLFSVWDKSSEMYQGKDDPRLVAPEDRVQVLSQASDVEVKRFGGEGTGAQCIDDTIGWEVGTVVRFIVECRRTSSGRTCYAAFVCPGQGAPWKHLATYRVAGGKPFKGFYSFIEDFRRDHISTLCEREAVFGPVWFRDGSQVWQPAVQAGFTASSASWERPDNIDTREGPCVGTRVLCTGGDFFAGQSKLQSVAALKPGSDEHLACAPCAEFPVKDDDDFRHLLAAKPRYMPTPACPLCGGSLNDGRGPFCGGDVCEPAQCLFSDTTMDRCVWPRCEGAAHCPYHASKGKKCPLCGADVAAGGPYCAGDGSCCGAAQCQKRSPFPAGGRCPFPCSGGATCRLHVV
eukprot:TRINITY_DN77947_c0_g1_i1.p1 TRINITY_DN77947_c0_g1~~TRINITY_DN77947_c0_g1_i1.p1  ORF type:complete len:427 (-),score=65.31 TRINITY_DN77947_c0_g1_i1:261-1541(-)